MINIVKLLVVWGLPDAEKVIGAGIFLVQLASAKVHG